MTRMHKLAILALAVSMSTACAKASKEDCAKIMPKIMKFEMDLSDDLIKTMMEGEEGKKLIEQCASDVPKSDGECVLKAADKAAYEKCK
ncbi:MAG: hypothetical protein ACE366_30820 [Bradymonadia bacterium]